MYANGTMHAKILRKGLHLTNITELESEGSQRYTKKKQCLLAAYVMDTTVIVHIPTCHLDIEY